MHLATCFNLLCFRITARLLYAKFNCRR